MRRPTKRDIIKKKEEKRKRIIDREVRRMSFRLRRLPTINWNEPPRYQLTGEFMPETPEQKKERLKQAKKAAKRMRRMRKQAEQANQ